MEATWLNKSCVPAELPSLLPEIQAEREGCACREREVCASMCVFVFVKQRGREAEVERKKQRTRGHLCVKQGDIAL